MKSKLPMRAAVPNNMTEQEKNCIAWSVISGCSLTEAFSIFCRPDLKDTKTILERVASQFFSMSEVSAYIDAYSKLIDSTMSGNQSSSPEFSEPKREDLRERKVQAVNKLLEYVIEQSNNIDDVDDKEALIKIADKLGLLDTEEKAEESPRRYLPETCSNCRYKQFIEENCIDE